MHTQHTHTQTHTMRSGSHHLFAAPHSKVQRSPEVTTNYSTQTSGEIYASQYFATQRSKARWYDIIFDRRLVWREWPSLLGVIKRHRSAILPRQFDYSMDLLGAFISLLCGLPLSLQRIATLLP